VLSIDLNDEETRLLQRSAAVLREILDKVG
jgi:hypothetical protein